MATIKVQRLFYGNRFLVMESLEFR
ncbi:hypothetical protein X777_08969 [Ooceraea biroi]|uniref:Uncharacterized protein n=1 Tax=Ooceraea biroi TaxID=2015173 RepID=A0A026WB87_OOCBI|nr:hypothetical protein X777_08969 [Ooceraea biroi]